MHAATLYSHETLSLDGEVFEGCEFRDCRLVYAGGPPPRMLDCRFERCEWKLEGAAADTLAMFKLVWAVGGKAPVQAWIKDVTGGGGR